MIVGVGCDVVRIDRIRRALDAHGMRFVDRICVHAEAMQVRSLAKSKQPEFVSQGVSWRDVEVRSKESGAPFVHITGQARKVFDGSATHAHVSLSHEKDHAMAFVLLERRAE